MPTFHLDVKWLTENRLDESNKLFLCCLFQMGCPGCFAEAIPAIVRLVHEFQGQPFQPFLVSTAFEDWEINTEANTVQFLATGKTVGVVPRSGITSLKLGYEVINFYILPFVVFDFSFSILFCFILFSMYLPHTQSGNSCWLG